MLHLWHAGQTGWRGKCSLPCCVTMNVSQGNLTWSVGQFQEWPDSRADRLFGQQSPGPVEWTGLQDWTGHQHMDSARNVAQLTRPVGLTVLRAKLNFRWWVGGVLTYACHVRNPKIMNGGQLEARRQNSVKTQLLSQQHITQCYGRTLYKWLGN